MRAPSTMLKNMAERIELLEEDNRQLRAAILMYREIISMVWPIGDIRWRTYWFYVRGLTVEH